MSETKRAEPTPVLIDLGPLYEDAPAGPQICKATFERILDHLAKVEEENHQLLQALGGIIENAEYQHGTTYEISTKWIEKAEAAIARARGQE